MRRTLLLAAVLLLAPKVLEAQVMIAVPPKLSLNNGPCPLVTGGGVGPFRGEFCYQTDTNQLQWWNMTAWQSVSSSVNATLTNPTITGGTATGLTLTNPTITGGTITGTTFANLTLSGHIVLSAAGSAAAYQLTNDLTIQVTDKTGIGGPGAGYLTLRVRRGTNLGTCKLVAVGGTALGETTIVDNVGSNCANLFQ